MGDDILNGNNRSSTYVYHYGDGHDVIVDPGNVGTTPDVLSLRGIVRDDLTVVKEGNDLILYIRDIASGDSSAVSGSIRIKNGVGAGKLEQYQFENEVLDYNQLLSGSTVYDDVYRQNTTSPIFEICDDGGTDTLIFIEGIREPGDRPWF
jgi:Ca2+-binding RTX toxin-like protein